MAGEKITSAEEKQLLNSTEIMVATAADNGGNWDVSTSSPRTPPPTWPRLTAASNGTMPIVFWRSAYASSDDPFAEGEPSKSNFDTQDAIWLQPATTADTWR